MAEQQIFELELVWMSNERLSDVTTTDLDHFSKDDLNRIVQALAQTAEMILEKYENY